jgi:hypothetical protein
MADHADIGQCRRIAMAEAAGILMAGKMRFESCQCLHRPVPSPRRLLRIP